eukprot:12147047-Heterocapsa_arctica.AAC.1
MATFLESLMSPPTTTTKQPNESAQPITPNKPLSELSELSEMDENVGQNVWQGPPTTDDSNPTP